MDKNGYKLIEKALKDAEIDAIVQPKPKKNEDVRFLTIDTEPGSHTAADVLNALARAGFMSIENYTDIPLISLRALGTTGINGILLEDQAAESMDNDH